MQKLSKGRRSSKRQRPPTPVLLYPALCRALERSPIVIAAGDNQALNDILVVQCAGDERRAVQTLIELERGPFRGRTLGERWIELLAYYEAGRPRAPRPLTAARRRDLLAVVRHNARLAIAPQGRVS